MPLEEFITTSLRRKTRHELKEMRATADTRMEAAQKSTLGRQSLDDFADKIEIEQERKTNRLMLQIAIAGLAVAAVTGFGTLVLELVKFFGRA